MWKWFKRLTLLAVLLVLCLAAPVLWVEATCRGNGAPSPYAALLPPEHHRPEARTILTYPEWHIVHAYDDYAEVLHGSDPHDFRFLPSIGGFWSSLCTLSKMAPEFGGIDGSTKQMIYVIGVSFTAEWALKAAYEETIGRVFSWIRGPQHAPLDKLSARQAADYAAFLTQVPWYKWDFRASAAELAIVNDEQTLRDRERRFALGIEYRAKAVYADVIAQAVAATGNDELTLRMIVAGGDAETLADFEGVSLIETGPSGAVIETPRYRVLTHLLQKLASAGWDFVEMAGNDQILFTVLSESATHPNAFTSLERQGYGDHRHLVLQPVRTLADALRSLPESGATLEHIHDY